MNEDIQNTSPKENFWLWFLKIAAGLLIIIFLGVHFVVNHLIAPGGLLNYDQVINLYSNLLFPIFEGVFLITVIFHALIGFRSILLDLNLSNKLQKWIDTGLILLGTISSVYGIWLLFVLSSRAG